MAKIADDLLKICTILRIHINSQLPYRILRQYADDLFVSISHIDTVSYLVRALLQSWLGNCIASLL